MFVERIQVLHEDYIRLTERFKALWTFHQFLRGVYKTFFSSEPGYSLDFNALYDQVKSIAADINDLDGLKAEAIAARQDGFLAKAVIHPKHVDVVNAAFLPTDEEIKWSERVVAAFAGNPSGVVNMDGKMLDKPHLRAAKKILAQRGR